MVPHSGRRTALLAAALAALLVGGAAVAAAQSDQFEPNDDFDEAATIEAGTYTDLVVENGEDDFYAVDLEAGQELEALVEFAHAEGDLDLAVYGPDGGRLDSSISTTDDESARVTANEAGVHYVRVYGFGDASNSYDLAVDVAEGSITPTPAPDEYEPNDSPSSAATIEAGTYTDLRVGEAGDDYYAVELEAGEELAVDAAFDHDAGDIDLELLDSEGDQVAESISVTDGESARRVAREDGVYLVHVYTFGAVGNSYDLTVEVTDTGSVPTPTPTPEPLPETDRFEPNDDIGAAVPIAPGEYGDLVVRNGGNDYYAVRVDAGASLEATATFDHGRGDVDLLVLAPDGDQLETSTSTSDDESVRVTADEAGVYYVQVYGFGDTGNSYDLTVDVGGDPPTTGETVDNDGFDRAIPLEPGLHEGLAVPAGESYVALEMDAGQTVTAVLASGDDADIQLTPYGPTRNELSSEIDGQQVVQFTADREGVHYIGIDADAEATAALEITEGTATPTESDDGDGDGTAADGDGDAGDGGADDDGAAADGAGMGAAVAAVALLAAALRRRGTVSPA